MLGSFQFHIASEKGKLAARRGRKTTGPLLELAGRVAEADSAVIPSHPVGFGGVAFSASYRGETGIYDARQHEPAQGRVGLPPFISIALIIGAAVAIASTVVVVRAWYNVTNMSGVDVRQTYATSLMELGILLAAALTLAGIAWWLVVRLHESQRLLRDLAVRDPLTGLYNRRYFREVYASEMQRARRSGVPFSVAMLDLDGFKAFNDTNGHAAGDEVLESFAEVLRASVRSGDVLARYGGDEFVILMPSTTAGNASTAIARLERNVAQWRPLGAPHGLHVSIGICTWDAFTDPLEKADMRMYESKRDKALTEALEVEPLR